MLNYLIALGLLFCTLFYSLGSAAQTESDEFARLQALKKSIDALKLELDAAKQDRGALLNSLEDTEKSVGDLSEKAKSLEKQLRESQEKLKQLRDERSHLKQQIDNQQAHVSQHINTAYRLGQQSHLRLLLNQQNPSTVARNLKYYDYFIQARSKKILDFTDNIDRLNAIEPEITFAYSQLKKHRSELQKQQNHLLQAQEKRKITLAKLNTAITNKDQRLAKLKQDRQHLEKLLDEVSKYIGDIDIPNKGSAFSSLKGKLPRPSEGKIIRQYGSTRVDNRLKWEGLLIRAKAGSQVSAVHHGRVVFADYLRGHGLLIILDHGSDFMTLYAHNQTLYKELGEWVNTGEAIASVGNTGGRHESALYFELRHKGQPQNPRRWFKSA